MLWLLLNSLVQNTLNVDRLHVNVLCDHCHRIICNFYWAQVNMCVCQWIHFILFLCCCSYVFPSPLFSLSLFFFLVCVFVCLIVHLVYTNFIGKLSLKTVCFKHCNDLYMFRYHLCKRFLFVRMPYFTEINNIGFNNTLYAQTRE